MLILENELQRIGRVPTGSAVQTVWRPPRTSASFKATAENRAAISTAPHWPASGLKASVGDGLPQAAIFDFHCRGLPNRV